MRARVRRGRRGFLQASWLALALLALFGRVDRARALEEKPLQQMLQVRPGATCLSNDGLAAQVAQWLESDTVRSDVVIVVDGSSSDPRSARLRVVREGQTVAHRKFEPGPARCESFRAAMSLAIALALKASLLDELGEPLPDDPVQRVRGWSLSAAALGSYGLLPGVAPGLELGARFALGSGFVLRFGALALFAIDVALARSPYSFDAVLGAARVDACARIQLSDAVRARGCAGLLAGPLYARGHQSEGATGSVVGWLAWANALGLDVELTERWSLAIDLSLALRLRQLRIGVENSRGSEVAGQSLAALGYGLSAGPLYRF